MTTIGVDVGGTKIAAALVSDRGAILRSVEVASTPDDGDRMIDLMVQTIRELDTATSTPVGVAVAGYLDRARAVMRFAPNISWRNLALKARLEEGLGRDVHLENDANAAAFGEWRHGAGRGSSDLLVATLGTGVGGGVILDGSVLAGGSGIAGEVGHLTVQPDGRECGCGLRGCLEAYASGTALERSGQVAVAESRDGSAALAARCGGDPEKLTSRNIVALAAEGDPLARELVSDVGRWLGRGLASMSAVLDPDRIVVGGGLAEVGDAVLRPARETFSRIQTQGHRTAIDIRLAELGNDAGVIGAAALAEATR